MSAEVLRRAAALMRERAEAATPGPWETYRNMHDETFVSEVDRRGFGVISGPATGRDDYGRGNAEHIASWHPAVALAVADWLEAEARRADFRERQQRETNAMLLEHLAPYPAYYDRETHRALAVARAYLGDSSC